MAESGGGIREKLQLFQTRTVTVARQESVFVLSLFNISKVLRSILDDVGRQIW